MGNEGSQQFKYGETLENDIKVSWKVCKENRLPRGREGHCACSIGQSLYIFGGVTHLSEGLEECNQLFKYNQENGVWEELKAEGTVPHPRAGATLVAVGTKLYLFGGLNHEHGWLEQVFVFDTESKSWHEAETVGPSPSPRDKLASAVIGDKIYIFGGFGPQGMEDVELDEDEEDDDGAAQFGWFNDLYVFDTATNTWNNPLQMNVGAPSPRAATGMTAVGKYLVIFGGKDAVARKNDLYIFDTENKKWIQDLDKMVSGRQPDPRSFHAAATVGHRVVITGGRGVADQHFQDFHIFDTKTKEWLQPSVEGDVVAGRGAHSLTVVGDRLVMFGGSSHFSAEIGGCEVLYNDVNSINTGTILAGRCTERPESHSSEIGVATSAQLENTSGKLTRKHDVEQDNEEVSPSKIMKS